MRSVNKIQILIGGAALFVGSLVYLIDRPPDQTYFVYSSSIGIGLHDALPNLFGLIGYSLPAFIHVFSFILITAGLISCKKKDCLIICSCWLLVDIAFELGQKFNSFIPGIIPDWFATVPFLENTENYFLKGTFDFIDMMAILIGTISAYFILIIAMQKKGY